MDLLNLFVKVGVENQASDQIEGISNDLIGKLGRAASTVAKTLAGLWAVKKVADFGRAAFDAYASFEQLAGGTEKIFDELDQSKILEDANRAFLDLNMSANDYLESINTVGATFAQTMGDEKAYDTARTGMKAIADFASGTGANLNELNEKYKLISRSAGSYQSIADQFAGILPQTSNDFLEQAKAAGFLKDSYEKLTDVPVAEYQEAVTKMLEKGVEDAGFANNTMKESLSTISGSIAATKAAWQNLVTELGKPDADIGARIGDMLTAVMGENGEGGLLRNVTSEVGTIVRNMVGAIGQALQAGVSYIFDNGPQLISDAMASIGGALEKAWTSVLDFNVNFDKLLENMTGSGANVADGVMRFVERIGDAFSDSWPYVQEQLSALLGQIGNLILTRGPEIVGNAADAFLSLAEWITSNGPMLVDRVGEIIGNVISAARDWLVNNGPAILAAAKETFGNIVTAIAEHAPRIIENISRTIGRVIGYIIDAAPRMLSAAVEFMGGLITGTSEEGKKVHKWFADFFPDGLLKGLGDFGKFLLDAGKSLINGLIDGISEVAPDVGEAILGAFDSVMEFFGNIGEFIKDPVGTIQKAFSDMDKNVADFSSNADKNMGDFRSSVERGTSGARTSISSYNGAPLVDKTATAKVDGNAVDGKAKDAVKETDSTVASMQGNEVTAKVTGNASDGKAKGLVSDTTKAISNMKSNSVEAKVTGNAVESKTADKIWNVVSAIGNMTSKTIDVVTNQRTVVSRQEKAWGGIRTHAAGGVKVANNYGDGVPLDIVGERGPEAIVPLKSPYGNDFARLMGMEAAKYVGGKPSVNIYLNYNDHEDATQLVEDIAHQLSLVM